MPWAWVLGLALVLAAALVLAVFALRGAARSRRAVVRARRAVAGEAAGATLLEAHGYEILGVQVAASYPLVVDGAEARFGVRADYIVSRDGRRLVAEVKTGAVAPRLDHAPTRRQVLEYGVAFGCDGVVLVDVEAAALHEIALPWLADGGGGRVATSTSARRPVALAFVFAGALALGTLVAALR